jgi:adenylate cyclase
MRVESYSRSEAANRAGVDLAYVERMIGLGLLMTDDADRLSERAIRRLLLIQALEHAGLPLEGLADIISSGSFSLDFIETAGYEAFAPLAEITFSEASVERELPLDLLMAVREVMGGLPAKPFDRMREDELAVLPLVELQYREGFRPHVIERTLRVYGDSLRRIAETEAEWWRSEVQERMLAAGQTEADVARYAHDFSPRLSLASDQALLAIYHTQQRHAWSVNIVGGIASALERAGVHARSDLPPAMCFLDITGYTRLTAEQGDSAAAALAERIGRMVQRISVQHAGRPVKWLGDGVMLYFPHPGPGVEAALEMVAAVAEAGLPPAHVGLHAGPVLFQEGDYYGQTVNTAARIGDYARPGEVLVSQAVVDVVGGATVQFREIGPVELKGVAGVTRLYQALPTG